LVKLHSKFIQWNYWMQKIWVFQKIRNFPAVVPKNPLHNKFPSSWLFVVFNILILLII
jgi:hypothetical protein